MVLDNDLVSELQEVYTRISTEEKITQRNISKLFSETGEGVPTFKIRDYCSTHKKGIDDEITFDEFIAFFEELGLSKAKGRQLKQNVQSKSGVTHMTGYEQTSSGTVHSMTDSERISFTNFVNYILANDPDCKAYLPLDPNSDDLFTKLEDGVLLCKLVNVAADKNPPIDERAISKKKNNNFTANQNLSLALNSAKSTGLHIVNIGPEDIKQKRVHLCLGILWQIIRKYYIISLNLQITPDLLCVLRPGETSDDFRSMSPEDILLRWVEFQIHKVNLCKTITNFSSDFKDSVVYSALQSAIFKDKMIHDSHTINNHNDLMTRASMVTENSSRAGITSLVSPIDIVGENSKLNILYVAEMFRKFPCLEKVEAPPEIEESREVKSYRNWINSLGIQPAVTYFYINLSDGHVLLKICDIIRPNVVNWSIVNNPPYKVNQAFIKKTENCNQVIEICTKQFKLSLVGVSGANIAECSELHVLSLVWQLMRMYTIQKLVTLSNTNKPLKDDEIIQMVNKILSDKNKPVKLRTFKDPDVISSHVIFHFVDAIKPDTVNWSIVTRGINDEVGIYFNKEKMSNAKYALSVARIAGATVYALPEDIMEGKTKMIMIVFAFLLMAAYQ